MKNLELVGVQEMNTLEMRETDGGVVGIVTILIWGIVTGIAITVAILAS